jgi:UDP-GlcNAc:undecaprenyl-phosphate/decaprenyl-phosphate GlcNAc-1-phosphate transferase
VNHLVATGLSSFAVSLVLTPILRDVFRSLRVVDQPDRKRKIHVHPIPRVGGIAIAISYFLVFYLVRQTDGAGLDDQRLSIIFRILPAGLLVFATGLVDDLFGLKPWQKFIGQFAAAGLAYWGGVHMSIVGGYVLPDIWSFPLTVVWLVLCTNAFNLVDGLDGLASGVGLFATLTIFTAAMLTSNEPLAFATLALAGSLLGFLCFNFNPATVFLGDCGSLLIGFLLGCFGVIWAQKTVTLLGIAAPFMALSVPLLDVSLCIVRRWLGNQPIFSADRGHIHHRLLDRGLTPKQAVFILYGLSSLAAIFSLAQSFTSNAYVSVLIGIAFLVLVWTVVHKLRYAEFILAGKLLRIGELQRSVSGSLTLSAFEKSIARATTPEEYWGTLLDTIHAFGFSGARMRIGVNAYEHWPEEIHGPKFWLVRIPLNERGDYVELARQTGSQSLPMVVAPFLDLVAGALGAKANEQEFETASTQAPTAVHVNP